MKATIMKDKNDPNTIRVEAIDADGGVEVAMFSGPAAVGRAENFAFGHYDDVEDPDDLTV